MLTEPHFRAKALRPLLDFCGIADMPRLPRRGATLGQLGDLLPPDDRTRLVAGLSDLLTLRRLAARPGAMDLLPPARG